MTIRKITTFPAGVLRKEAEAVKDFNHDLKNLVDDMIETMRDAPGVGLAAPQVGVSKRVVVVEFGDEEDDTIPKQLYVLINPEIINKSNDMVAGIEGCLSVPGLVGEVERAKVVTVSAQDQSGAKIKIRAQGWLARIFQHEIDHINGLIYPNRTEKLWQIEPEEMDSM